jgi:hypothetical protein
MWPRQLRGPCRTACWGLDCKPLRSCRPPCKPCRAACWELDYKPLRSCRPPCKSCHANHRARGKQTSHSSTAHHVTPPCCPWRAWPVATPRAELDRKPSRHILSALGRLYVEMHRAPIAMQDADIRGEKNKGTRGKKKTRQLHVVPILSRWKRGKIHHYLYLGFACEPL